MLDQPEIDGPLGQLLDLLDHRLGLAGGARRQLDAQAVDEKACPVRLLQPLGVALPAQRQELGLGAGQEPEAAPAGGDAGLGREPVVAGQGRVLGEL